MKPAARIGLAAGLAILGITLLVPAPTGLPAAGWYTLGLAIAMAVLWSTEPVPIGVTALLPLIVLPILGIRDFAAAAAPYANPLVFLFLGGFFLAAGVKPWGLHERFALITIRIIGTNPRRLVLGFMAACGFLSMWISNTAAVVLMLPIALSIIAVLGEAEKDRIAARNFAVALLLGLAYSASIGGMGTLIGTPPNAMLAAYLGERHDIDLSFVAWSIVAFPLVLAFLPLAWVVLTRVAYPVPRDFAAAAGKGLLVEQLGTRGAMSPAERRLCVVFSTAALLWICRPFLSGVPSFAGLTDSSIALICGAALFLVPSGMTERPRFLLTWSEAKDIPWDVLLLFGGGLSLAAAMDSTGLTAWIGTGLGGLGDVPPWIFLIALTTTVVFLTELASNTAIVAALLPIAATIAASSGVDIVTISAAVAMSASCAFMLPVATPPNALVFASGHVTVASMMRAGVIMNILSVVLVAGTAYVLAPLLHTVLPSTP